MWSNEIEQLTLQFKKKQNWLTLLLVMFSWPMNEENNYLSFHNIFQYLANTYDASF